MKPILLLQIDPLVPYFCYLDALDVLVTGQLSAPQSGKLRGVHNRHFSSWMHPCLSISPLPLRHGPSAFLSTKLKGPFFCFRNLYPEPLQRSWLTTTTTSVTF